MLDQVFVVVIQYPCQCKAVKLQTPGNVAAGMGPNSLQFHLNQRSVSPMYL